MIVKKMSLFVVLVVFLLCVGLTIAEGPGGATIGTPIDYGEMNISPAGNVSIESGNITVANLSSNVSTVKWAGVYGEVTGNILLADANEDDMFVWTANGRIVYASTGAPIWANLEDATAADVMGIIIWLSDGDVDNYTGTFDQATEDIGSDMFSISSDFAYTYNQAGVDTWKTYSLWDTTNLVWAGLVSEDGVSYRGDIADFQMILPEDGTNLDYTSVEYFLFIELK